MSLCFSLQSVWVERWPGMVTLSSSVTIDRVVDQILENGWVKTQALKSFLRAQWLKYYSAFSADLEGAIAACNLVQDSFCRAGLRPDFIKTRRVSGPYFHPYTHMHFVWPKT